MHPVAIDFFSVANEQRSRCVKFDRMIKLGKYIGRYIIAIYEIVLESFLAKVRPV